jgi:hypothetical protein
MELLWELNEPSLVKHSEQALAQSKQGSLKVIL